MRYEIMGLKERSLLDVTLSTLAHISKAQMGGVTMNHYHIRWSGKELLDWQRFSTPEEAKSRARQLVRQGETYTIEEHDETCPRCNALLNATSRDRIFNEASA